MFVYVCVCMWVCVVCICCVLCACMWVYICVCMCCACCVCVYVCVCVCVVCVCSVYVFTFVSGMKKYSRISHGYYLLIKTLFLLLYRYQQSNGYLPRPLDLSVVTVPEDLMVLVNLLAENNHNVWAMERIKEGWKYGSASVSCIMWILHLYY